MNECFGHEDNFKNHIKKEFLENYNCVENEPVYAEYERILKANTEKLEEYAYMLQGHALKSTNLTARYKNFNDAKSVLKIAELIRKLKKGEPRE